MDAGYISAISALAGSAIGALASLATSWLTQHAQTRTTRQLQDRARREALYGDFIGEASRLFADAFEHQLGDPATLVKLYALVSTMRLFGAPRTISEAEAVVDRIEATYFAPNKELRRFANFTREGELDPLYAFSCACRDELRLTRA